MRWDRSLNFAIIVTMLLVAAPAVAEPDSGSNSTPKVVFILSICPSPKLIDAAEDCAYLESDIYLTENLPDDCDLTQYDLVFVDWLWKMTPNLDRLLTLIDEAKAHDVPVIVTKSYYTAKPAEIGNIDPDEHPWVRQYWVNMSEENANSLLTYLGVEFLGMDCGEIKEPIPITHEGIYHPDAERVFGSLSDYLKWYDYDPDKPTIGILFHETDYLKSGTRVEDSLIQAFEDRGFNVVAYFYPHSGRPDPDNFLIKDNKSVADVIIHYKMFGWHQNAPLAEVISELERLNVPVIKGQKFYRTYEEWFNGTQGLQPSAIGTTIEPSDRNGIFDPIVISVREFTDQELGIFVNKPIPRQVNWIVNRTIAQANLRYRDNSEKKVAILYWSHPGKDQGAGASQIDVYASFPRLLAAMQDHGYDLGAAPLPNTTDMVNLTRNQGRNIGIWAPDEITKLVQEYPIALVPEDEYLNWFMELNDAKREEVIDMWGPPPGDIMVYKNETGTYLVLPIISFGNVILAPEPSRGYDQNQTALYHDGTIPPTHQYLAFYFWLKKDFGADAMIRFARHGTVAWLPGKTGTGLDRENCWSAIVIQDIPVVYPFTVEGIGEGVLPKRRCNALMIDHLTPPIIAAGLYGNLSKLHPKIHLYDEAEDLQLKIEYRNTIIKLYEDLNFEDDLNVSADYLRNSTEEEFDDFVVHGRLHLYLHELAGDFMPYGLHIFGTVPDSDWKVVAMVKSMLGDEFVEHVAEIYPDPHDLNPAHANCTVLGDLLNETILNHSSPESAQKKILGNVSASVTADLNVSRIYAANIRKCVIEIPRTLDALDGTYIPSGMGGDPINNPDVLPTGRNFYAFDPRIVPTEEAERVGVYLTDELLSKHRNETGEYPKKVAFMLWATHTTQDKGVMEAQILHLLGVRSVRDKKGYVTGVELIDASELGRPRIDVVVTTTALYLDLYRCRLDILDKAVRLAHGANDTENYVRIDSDAIYSALSASGNCTEEEARDLSLCRIFAQEPGNHHNSEQHALLASGTWEDESALAETYLGTFSHVYGVGKNGEEHLRSLYADNLNGSEIAMFRRGSNVGDLIHDDDFFGYFGGLGLTIRSIGGETPKMWVNNLENPEKPKLETLRESLSRDTRTRYFNPKWIRGMQEHGAAGAREFARFHEHLFGWDVSDPDAVTENMWNEAYDIYVQDKYDLGLEEWFNESNPYAYQAITARMLEAARKEYWNPPEEVKERLAKEYQKSVDEYGVACCHHTCGNPFLDEYREGILSAPGMELPDPGGVEKVPGAKELEEVVGQVIELTEFKTDITFSGMEMTGLIAVFLTLVLLYAGFRYKYKKR